MTGLVIKLKPNEKMLVNGVLMQNCDRATRIRIKTSDVSILRLRDALHPDEVNTPIKRIYYIAQLAVAGEAAPEDAQREILDALTAVREVFRRVDEYDVLDKAQIGAEQKKFFVVMRAMKKLFSLEEQLLNRLGKDAGDV